MCFCVRDFIIFLLFLEWLEWLEWLMLFAILVFQSIVMQELICDTNIWYNLAQNPPAADFLNKYKLIATFSSIEELARTPKLLTKMGLVRGAIQAIFKYSKYQIFEFPFVYLRCVSDVSFEYNVLDYHKEVLNFTSQIAKGAEITDEKIIRQHIETRRNDLKIVASMFNEEAQKIKARIRNTTRHRAISSSEMNRQLISKSVAYQTDGTGLGSEFDWNQIELFEKVLAMFFKELEVGAIVAKPNDFFDVFQLIYVNPSRLYWTQDKKKTYEYIKRAGMERYLLPE